ncbi:hypothetical protein ACFFRR_010438 [Megaselia abdita]
MKTIGILLCITLACCHANPFGSRIAGGDEAEPGQFPFQVGLSITKENDVWSWCGGSIIAKRWILTAAHCLNRAISIEVWLGTNKVNTYPIPKGTQKIVVSDQRSFIKHSNFDSSNLAHDIGLIALPVEVMFNGNIEPVNLPIVSKNYANYTNYKAIAAGWGRIADDKPGTINDLRFVNLAILELETCAMYYKKGLVEEKHICVETSNGRSTCTGDSGGPLVLSGTRVQIGLVSFGASTGCQKNVPVVLTRITSYMDWIREKTGLQFATDELDLSKFY